MFRHILALSALSLLAAAGDPRASDKAKAPAVSSAPCAVGEEKAAYKGVEVCKPVGGACGKGRKHQAHNRYPELIVCVDDPNAHAAQINCGEHERPVYPKRHKPYCEPIKK